MEFKDVTAKIKRILHGQPRKVKDIDTEQWVSRTTEQ
jgi:hypothetical protein